MGRAPAAGLIAAPSGWTLVRRTDSGAAEYDVNTAETSWAGLAALLHCSRHRDDSRERVPAGAVADGVEAGERGVQVGGFPGGKMFE